MATSKVRPHVNKILLAIPEKEFASFSRGLTRVDLPRRTPLETPKKEIEQMFFIEEGIASIVAAPDRDTQVEVGIIGHEGVTGLSVIHLNDRALYSSYMQVGGFGYRTSSKAVRDLMEKNAECRRVFLAFAQAFLIQACETAVANVRATVEERLARWLLMAQDRVGGEEIPLTHEFLAMMMGARRPGVTEAMQELERKGLVDGKRGRVIIIDRAGLEERAGPYYGVPEAELLRLMRK
jgi:CRP-like cAMP-binding protein